MEVQGIVAPFCYAGNATYASIMRAFKHGLSIVYLVFEIYYFVVQVSSLRGLRKGFISILFVYLTYAPLRKYFFSFFDQWSDENHRR